MSIVTRFAPSPTGYLHIGGARTALFNYLYAKHMGGKFLLRIEDTDKERNNPEAVEAIYDGLARLGLEYDGQVVLQSKRADRHVEVAEQLMLKGAAYRDYTTVEEVEAMRAQHKSSGIKGPFRYQSPWADIGRGIPEVPGPRGPDDVPHVVRLYSPREGSTTIEDLVQGTVTVQNSELDDMVLLRSDGSPTYMLAVVVDDHDMGVTHVIRGDDHLNNAFRQLPIYDAMGWDRPQYAHIPLIHDSAGKKLSKRTGAAAVEEYTQMGILPAALVNYLSRLGWGHGDDELFSMEQAIEWFDIKDVGRNPARLDLKKLINLNGQYIRNMSAEDLASKWVGPRLHDQGIDYPEATLVGAMEALQERSADLNALTEGTMFLWQTGKIDLDEPIAGDSAEFHYLQVVYHDFLPGIKWTHDELKAALDNAAQLLNTKLGKVVAPLRMALTGSKVSPPITDVMLLLGKEQSLARIEDIIYG